MQDVQQEDVTGVVVDDELTPVQRVVTAAHADNLTRQILETVGVTLPDGTEESTTVLLLHMSDLIADAVPDPSTTDELQDILAVVVENLETTTTTTTTYVEPNDGNFDENGKMGYRRL